jgi:protease-4
LLEKVADGRVFTGRQAVDLKLIDQLGDEKTAVAWLVARRASRSDLPVRDFKLSPRFGDLTFLRTAASITLDALGLSAIARQIEQAGVAQAVDRSASTACWRCGARGVQLNRAKSGFHIPPALRVLSQPQSGPFVTSFRAPKFHLAS